MNHTCPGPGCTASVPTHMLACRRHWYQVSPATRAWVWQAWANGAGAGTADHMAAIDQAITEMKP